MSILRKKSRSVDNLPRTISTDGLKISLKGNIPQQKRGYRKITGDINLKYRGYGHQTFENVAEVYFSGEKIGIMELFPRSLMSPDTVLFSVDNKLQYSAGWTKKLKTVIKDLNLSFNHLCRLDIAVDSPYRDQFNFIQKVITGKLVQVGNTRFSPLYDGTNPDGSAKLIYFTFGSRSSDKFIRAYYKRQELAKSNKYYIEDFWQANGFDLKDGDEVARFEFVLKRKELKRYIDINEKFGELNLSNLDLLEAPEYLAALFNTAKKGFFEFVSKRSLSRTGNITRCARKLIVDVSDITTYLLFKLKSKATTAIYSAKISAKFLFMLCCKTCDNRYMAEIEEILYNFNLRRWFEANRERFYKEFDLVYRSDNFEYLTNYTSNPKFVQAKIWKLHNFTL